MARQSIAGMATRSRSSRARGLKHLHCDRGRDHCRVALFASSWIETRLMLCTRLGLGVALFASAWIETVVSARASMTADVALFASAWIETRMRRAHRLAIRVALFASAWIETLRSATIKALPTCRALRERVD